MAVPVVWAGLVSYCPIQAIQRSSKNRQADRGTRIWEAHPKGLTIVMRGGAKP